MGLILGNGFGLLFLFYGLFCVGETIAYLLSFVYASDAISALSEDDNRP